MSRFTLAKYIGFRHLIEQGEKEFSPDDAFDVLEELLDIKNTGYIAIVNAVRKLKQENEALQELIDVEACCCCIYQDCYTKTALKKIKKDDLVELYLSLQQKLGKTAKIANEVIDEVEELRKQETKLLGMTLTRGEEINKLKEEITIYSILDDTYKGMSPNKKQWIDSNWKSIITGFAETLESQVPDDEITSD